MTRIVRENYPVADLPEALRDGLEEREYVRVTIEAPPQERDEAARLDASRCLREAPKRVLALDELFAMRRPPYVTTEQIVAEIRRQRDDE